MQVGKTGVTSLSTHMKFGNAGIKVAEEAVKTIANPTNFKVGTSYWRSMGAVVGSTFPAGLVGRLGIGLPVGLLIDPIAGAITGLVAGVALIPVGFKLIGSKLLKVVPK